MKKEYVDIVGEVANVYSANEVVYEDIYGYLYDVVYDALLAMDDNRDYYETVKNSDVAMYRNNITDPSYSQKFIKLENGTIVRWNEKELSPIFEDAKKEALADYKENHNPKNLILE